MQSSGLHCGNGTFAFGVLQLICGVALFCTDIANSVMFGGASLLVGLAYGFWGGIFLIITGSLGAAAGKKLPPGVSAVERKCLLIASLIMSILSSLNTFGLCIWFGTWVAASGLTCSGAYGCYDLLPISAAFLAFTLIAFISSFGQIIAAGMNLCNMPSYSVTTYTTSGQQQNPPGVVYVASPPQQNAQQPYPPQQGQPLPYPAHQGKV
jgi:hypothetical protein